MNKFFIKGLGEYIMKKMILENEDYVRVYENCPFRKGWIISLQVPTSEWSNSKYDKYR